MGTVVEPATGPVHTGGVAAQMRVKDAVGRFGEQTAAHHLTAAGMTILDRNWRPAGAGIRGELDLVARDGDALVIVEVKTRSGTGFGAPAESVTWQKTQRIRRLALAWLAAHPGQGSASIRFDVISVLRTAGGVTVEHSARGVLMSLARASCVALLGIEGHVVEVEVHLADGLPGVTLIGLPDASLYEARDRVKSAVVNSGQQWPGQRVTVGLFPAALPKSGSGFDAAVAAAVLAATGAVPPESLAGRVLLGELALDGRLRPIPGVLAAVLALSEAGFSRVVVPAGNAREAALVPGVEVEPIETLRDLVRLLRGEELVDTVLAPEAPPPDPPPIPDLAEVAGQPTGRLAMELAAAGGHHVLMLGPPGAGKTMLAERLPGLLPPLSEEQALEVTAVHSVAGALPSEAPLVRTPPFRNPHHSASLAAIVGGGSRWLRPGAASLAHRGVLFLDEASRVPAEGARCAAPAARKRRHRDRSRVRRRAVPGALHAGPGGQSVSVRQVRHAAG